MDRAIGEVFDFNGVKLQVKDAGDSCFCYGCYFFESKRTCNTVDYKNQAGACFRIDRTDNKNVIFVEVRDDKEKESKVMTREEAISFLDNTKVYVQGKSKEIQEKLFSLGFQWKLDGKKVRHEEKPFLFFGEDINIRCSDDMEYFTKNLFREITANDILNIIIDEPKYRPFKNAEECWQEMQKHQPFGWITLQCGQKSGSKASIIKLTDNCFYFVGDGSGICHNLYNYEFDKHFWLFADGTPFGIKVE